MPKNEQPDETGHPTQHRQVKVFCPDEDATIEVDAGIALLLESLWKLGISTFMSCEDNKDGRVWIDFSSSYDVGDFLQLVYAAAQEATIYPVGIAERISGYHRNKDGSWDKNNWDYDTVINGPTERADASGKDLDARDTIFCVNISVRFPRSDYPFVLQAIKSAVEAEQNP